MTLFLKFSIATHNILFTAAYNSEVWPYSYIVDTQEKVEYEVME